MNYSKTTIAIFILLSIITSQQLFSQEFYKYGVGITGGINIASLRNYSEIDSDVGIYLGAVFYSRINNYLGLGTEISYSERNFSSNNFKYLNQYIDIPLLLKAFFPIKNSKFLPSFYIGPYVSIPLKSKTEFSYSSGGQTDLQIYESTGGKVQFGASIGTNLTIDFGQFESGFEGRFSWGLGDEEINTIYIGLNIIAKFGFTKKSNNDEDDIWN